MGRLYRTLTNVPLARPPAGVFGGLTRNETLFHAVLGQFWILVCTEAQASLCARAARGLVPPPAKRKNAKKPGARKLQ